MSSLLFAVKWCHSANYTIYSRDHSTQLSRQKNTTDLDVTLLALLAAIARLFVSSSGHRVEALSLGVGMRRFTRIKRMTRCLQRSKGKGTDMHRT